MGKRPTRKVFTEFFIKNLKPGPVPYLQWDAKQAGFAVRVETTGYKAWKAIYKFGGRKRDYHIGAVAAIKIGEARRLAGKIMYQVADGIDPQAVKRAARTAGTFDDLADRYAKYSEKKNKSWTQAEALVKKHLRPKWGKLPAANISRSDVRGMMARLEDKPILGNQVLAAASAIFTWAINQEVGGVTANPCSGVERNETKERERILSDTELPKFWQAFGGIGARGAALKMLLLTGARPGEVAHMHVAQIVDGWWQLPGDPVPELRWPGTKNGSSHAIWLSSAAQEIISKMQSDGFVFAGAYGAPVFGLAAEMAKICETLGVERATPHDLRRSAGSAITRLGFGRDAMDRILNHRQRGIATVYDRHRYFEEDKRIMEAVAKHFAALVDGPSTDNVVPFAGKAL